MPRRTPQALLLAGLAGLTLLCLPAAAHASQESASIGHDIVIREGETSGDIACAFCNVRVHGDVHGDIAIAFGNLTVDNGHEVTGSVAVFSGDVELRDNTHIGGDTAVIGTLHEDDGSTISGSRSIVPPWIWPLILLMPFLVLGGIIWLIIHLIRRNRYRPMYPPYPPIRRY